MPPVPLAVAEPSLPPLQLTFVFAAVEADNTIGCVMVVDATDVQLFASVIVTVYVPAATPVMLAVAAALLHR